MTGRGTLAAVAIATAIRIVLERWKSEGQIIEATDVAKGHCEDFAAAVMEQLHQSEAKIAQDAEIVWSDEWWTKNEEGAGNAFRADIPRLRAEGQPLPEDIDDEELSLLIGGMTHAWIVHEGRHYDAGAPEGTSYFLELPFFRDQVARERDPELAKGAMES